MHKLFAVFFVFTLIFSTLTLAGTTHTSADKLKTYELIASESLKKDARMDEMNSLIASKDSHIKFLEEEKNLSSNLGMNFAVWTGILLASVTVIVTILGVAMAIFSFFGYKKMISDAKLDASNKASSIASKIAREEVPTATETVLIKLVKEGRFDLIISDSVERIVYRGVKIEDLEGLEGLEDNIK